MSNENPPAGNGGLSVVWTGPGYEVQNRFGLWRRDEPRTDLSSVQAASLGPGFLITRPDAESEAVAEAPVLPVPEVVPAADPSSSPGLLKPLFTTTLADIALSATAPPVIEKKDE